MLRYLVFFLILIHALIHLMGFLKAQNLASFNELQLPISKAMGWTWLAATLLLLVAAFGFLWDTKWWLVLLSAGVLLSQFLLISFWQDAKFGTVANLIIVVVLIAGYSARQFEDRFRQDVDAVLAPIASAELDLLTEADITHLPTPVQAYLRYTGSIGQPKVSSFKVLMHGQMRQDSADNWFKFRSEQYNTLADPSRLFFMKARVKGLPTSGYHAYQDQEALMLIKVLSFLPVVDIQEARLFQAETVTYFNDLCIMAPAALIDKRIRWEEIDDTRARAFFENKGVTISAELQFAEDGRLINFFSDDRTDINRREQIRFSTPIGEYHAVNGRLLPSYGEAVWHYPEAPFTYGQFHIDQISYNHSKSL